jgi:hypothetical protein
MMKNSVIAFFVSLYFVASFCIAFFIFGYGKNYIISLGFFCVVLPAFACHFISGYIYTVENAGARPKGSLLFNKRFIFFVLKSMDSSTNFGKICLTFLLLLFYSLASGFLLFAMNFYRSS